MVFEIFEYLHTPLYIYIYGLLERIEMSLATNYQITRNVRKNFQNVMTNFIIEKLQHYDNETKKVDTYKHSLK